MLTKENFIELCKSVEDPELHVDIWTLGLIYDYIITEKTVSITMTFTSPFCPYGPQLVDELKEKIKLLGVPEVTVEITFDPPWQPSEELREMLGF